MPCWWLWRTHERLLPNPSEREAKVVQSECAHALAQIHRRLASGLATRGCEARVTGSRALTPTDGYGF